MLGTVDILPHGFSCTGCPLVKGRKRGHGLLHAGIGTIEDNGICAGIGIGIDMGRGLGSAAASACAESTSAASRRAHKRDAVCVVDQTRGIRSVGVLKLLGRYRGL